MNKRERERERERRKKEKDREKFLHRSKMSFTVTVKCNLIVLAFAIRGGKEMKRRSFTPIDQFTFFVYFIYLVPLVVSFEPMFLAVPFKPILLSCHLAHFC